jgi:hypothetical protein
VSHHKHYTELAQLHGTTTDIIRRGSSTQNAIRTRHRCDSGTGNRNGEPASSPRRSCRFAEALYQRGQQDR